MKVRIYIYAYMRTLMGSLFFVGVCDVLQLVVMCTAVLFSMITA